MIEEADETRFLQARAGDHMMIPFQCDTCHFRNITKRDPDLRDYRDLESLEYIRRASLDAFWSREPSTVKKNLQGILRVESTMQRLRLPPVSRTKAMELKDECGMLAAIAVLDRSLDKGLYEDKVQFGTFRKARSCITNAHQASAHGMGDVIGAFERNKCWISNVSTHTFFFSRFMEGIHKRVGEVVKPDWPVPAAVVKEIDDRLNEAWRNTQDPQTKKKIAEMGTWYVGGFCTGLRGEEMLMIELAGTANSLKFLSDDIDPHFMFKILGRTKGRQVNGRSFFMPCIAVTGHLGLQPGRWVRRLVRIVHNESRTTGRLFMRTHRVPKLMEFEDDWYKMLEMIQNSTTLIDSSKDLREDAGLGRSLRRGVTSHAINMQVPRPLTNAINRWRKETNGAENRGSMPMVDAYSKLDSLKPTYLRFSKAL